MRINQIFCILFLLATDLVAVINKDMRICSNLIHQSNMASNVYWKIRNASLTAWYKFIPKYNIEPKTLIMV